MALGIGLSGVQAAQTDIDTIGNNIANVDTDGFKSSQANFANVVASSLSGASSTTASQGEGVNTSSVTQQFTEGTVNQTSNPLDVAINGSGLFELQTSTGIAYGRNGAFQIDSNGFIVSDTGAQLMGYAGASGAALGAPQPLQVDKSNIAPVATSSLTLDVNLPATDAPIDTVANPFSISNAASYNEATETTVYDSLGVGENLTTYYTQVSGSGTPNQWQVNWALTSSSGTVLASGAGPTLTFNSAGQLVSGGGAIGPITLADGSAPLNINLQYTGSTLSNVAFGVNSLTNNGNGGGQYTGVQFSQNGQVVAQYSNGATKVLGTIALANFANVQGLQQISNNLWVATQSSGQAILGVPGSSGLGLLQPSALEGSNVDLSTQLVNLIVAQQAYQANVQGINVDQQDVQKLLTLQ